MIAISSHRPLKDSFEFCKNQLRAKGTWNHAFDRIVYFGPEQEALGGINTTFIPCEQFPHIKIMVELCAAQSQWAALLNSDIVISPALRTWEQRLISKRAVAATSRRHEFYGEEIDKGMVRDSGLDFFCAAPRVWQKVAAVIPESFRIGHQQWDTWMLNFFMTEYWRQTYDITDCRLVFHPHHEDRKMPHTITVDRENPYMQGGGYPALKLP